MELHHEWQYWILPFQIPNQQCNKVNNADEWSQCEHPCWASTEVSYNNPVFRANSVTGLMGSQNLHPDFWKLDWSCIEVGFETASWHYVETWVTRVSPESIITPRTRTHEELVRSFKPHFNIQVAGVVFHSVGTIQPDEYLSLWDWAWANSMTGRLNHVLQTCLKFHHKLVRGCLVHGNVGTNWVFLVYRCIFTPSLSRISLKICCVENIHLWA